MIENSGGFKQGRGKVIELESESHLVMLNTLITKSPNSSFNKISATILTHSASGISGSYCPATS